jgi:hypothetical protein
MARDAGHRHRRRGFHRLEWSRSSSIGCATGSTGGVYNVDTGVETSVVDLYRLCTETAGVKQQPRFSPERSGGVRHSVLDGNSRRARARVAPCHNTRGTAWQGPGNHAGAVATAGLRTRPTVSARWEIPVH